MILNLNNISTCSMFFLNILLISYVFLLKNSIMSTFFAFSLLPSWSIKRLVRNTDQKHRRVKWYRITDTFFEYRKYRYFCKYRWFRYSFDSIAHHYRIPRKAESVLWTKEVLSLSLLQNHLMFWWEGELYCT
jgi:hypothetical protein